MVQACWPELLYELRMMCSALLHGLRDNSNGQQAQAAELRLLSPVATRCCAVPLSFA